MLMNATVCEAKAKQMDGKADECFSYDAAELYRVLAAEWRCLRVEALAHEASTTISGEPSV